MPISSNILTGGISSFSSPASFEPILFPVHLITSSLSKSFRSIFSILNSVIPGSSDLTKEISSFFPSCFAEIMSPIDLMSIASDVINLASKKFNFVSFSL